MDNTKIKCNLDLDLNWKYGMLPKSKSLLVFLWQMHQ